ncbi:MAG: hypothetical protein Fur0037_06780 [Planctomycetota bacterium]
MKSILIATLLAGAAAAQTPVCITGIVQPVGGPTICMQGETHLLEGTGVFLRSSAVDLNRWVGQMVRIEGVDIGLLCHVLDVARVGNALAVMQHCGTPMPGCTIKLKIGPGGLGRWAMFASFSPGFTPLGCSPPGFQIDGTLLLRGPTLLAMGLFTGPWGEVLVPIPPNPALQGLRIRFQGARQDIGPVGPIQFSNGETITIAPFMPPCGGVNC